MKIPTCAYCHHPAAWLRPWDRTRLCIAHFNKAFLKKVQKTINKYRLFYRDDVIAIGLSGGKDSVVMMNVMAKLQKKHPSTLIAITIDEGIENYRDDGIKFAKLAAENAGVEHHIFSFKDTFGYDLDEALVLLGENRLAPCSYCGPFRRKLLNQAAREVGATKLVTGHNASDEAQTLLMNLLRGDILKSLHSNPVPKFKDSAFVNRVKPFRKTSEQEIVLYANLNDIPYQEQSCPHATEAYRGRIREVIQYLSQYDPSVIFSVIKSADLLYQLAEKVPNKNADVGIKPLLTCQTCGEPSNGEQCNTCRLIEEIQNASEMSH